MTDKDEYEVVTKRAAQVVHCERRLPEQLFENHLSAIRFLDFDQVLNKSFWNTLTALSNDEDVFMVVFEPDPRRYYYHHFGFYSTICFSGRVGAEAYDAAIHAQPKDSPADAIIYSANTVLWFSPSLTWAIWGERRYGVCILGACPGTMESWERRSIGVTNLGIDCALKMLVAPNFNDRHIPEEFAGRFVLNYGPSARTVQ